MNRTLIGNYLVLLGAVLVMAFAAGCEPAETHEFDGTWNFTLTDGASSIFTGSITISYTTTEKGEDEYSGSGTIESDSFNINTNGVPDSGNIHLMFQQDGDTYEDLISFNGTLDGSTIAGVYICLGAYATGGAKPFGDGISGTFTATK